jgi:hypothetical protein
VTEFCTIFRVSIDAFNKNTRGSLGTEENPAFAELSPLVDGAHSYALHLVEKTMHDTFPNSEELLDELKNCVLHNQPMDISKITEAVPMKRCRGRNSCGQLKRTTLFDRHNASGVLRTTCRECRSRNRSAIDILPESALSAQSTPITFNGMLKEKFPEHDRIKGGRANPLILLDGDRVISHYRCAKDAASSLNFSEATFNRRVKAGSIELEGKVYTIRKATLEEIARM